jgi:hypothetical protein
VAIYGQHGVSKSHRAARQINAHFVEDGEVFIIIDTLEGRMTANPNDWIIRGVKGEIYPCKPDIFAATYEAADRPRLTRRARG